MKVICLQRSINRMCQNGALFVIINRANNHSFLPKIISVQIWGYNLFIKSENKLKYPIEIIKDKNTLKLKILCNKA